MALIMDSKYVAKTIREISILHKDYTEKLGEYKFVNCNHYLKNKNLNRNF